MSAREIDPNSPVYIAYHKAVARHIADGRVQLDTVRKKQWYAAFCRTGEAPWPWPRNSTTYALRATWKALEAGPIGRKARQAHERALHGLVPVKSAKHIGPVLTITRAKALDKPLEQTYGAIRDADMSRGYVSPSPGETWAHMTRRDYVALVKREHVTAILKKDVRAGAVERLASQNRPVYRLARISLLFRFFQAFGGIPLAQR